LDGNLNKLGRIACIKFDNPLDSIAILNGDVKLSLPLNNGTNEAPYCYPSKKLIEFITGYDIAAPNADISTAGKLFLKKRF
jgi:hypothetical protein